MRSLAARSNDVQARSGDSMTLERFLLHKCNNKARQEIPAGAGIRGTGNGSAFCLRAWRTGRRSGKHTIRSLCARADSEPAGPRFESAHRHPMISASYGHFSRKPETTCHYLCHCSAAIRSDSDWPPLMFRFAGAIHSFPASGPARSRRPGRTRLVARARRHHRRRRHRVPVDPASRRRRLARAHGAA